MSLSLRITSRSVSITPALLRASNAMPADMAPSPITATTWRFLSPVSPFSFAPRAMPSAALTDVLALRTTRKARDATRHAQAGHRLAPAGKDLVRIGLVPDVPHDPIVGRIE